MQEIVKNGTSLVGDSSGHTVSTSGNIFIGSNAGDSHQNTSIGEIIIINGTVSSEDRQKLEGYLAHKWALAGSLPVDHPYKSAAPVGGGVSVDLDGTVTDPEGSTPTALWSKVSGAGAVSFDNSSAVDTAASFLKADTYVLRLTADDGIDQAYDEVTITVTEGDVPDAPTGLAATAGDGSVYLDWHDGGPDVASYSVYRSMISNSYGSAFAINWSTNAYADNTVSNGTAYYYVVTAVDTNGNESAHSAEVSAVPESPYNQWASDNGVEGVSPEADSDGDGMNNLYEYAMGGNPTNRMEQGALPVLSKFGNGFMYVYPKRSDDDSLIYLIDTSANLMDSGSWTNHGYVVIGTNITGGTLNFVTNEVDTAGNEKFIRLRIQR
jgi:hypothetical protein